MPPILPLPSTAMRWFKISGAAWESSCADWTEEFMQQGYQSQE
jgi:hypothetical protein